LRHGFSVFAIESQFGEVTTLNDYVVDGKGDIDAALGIAGALAAGLIGREMAGTRAAIASASIASVGGALLLLALHRLVSGRRVAG
jgi:uncharacterized membrane protein YeaQ/YmgE (transglycosylase-associated protein family)